MNATTSLPGSMMADVSNTTLEARLQSVSTEGVFHEGERTPASILSKLTTLVTETLGNDTLHLNSSSSYRPGNWSSPVNATQIPTEDNDNGIKRLVVILTNIFVVVAIVATCFLAFQHRRWEESVRQEREKGLLCKYDIVDIEEEEEICEDYEIFDK
eukprot:XP_011676508.1 PREDICTED: uncharacterized protein LOC105444240 [Strongylocentrotus purpuratus]